MNFKCSRLQSNRVCESFSILLVPMDFPHFPLINFKVVTMKYNLASIVHVAIFV